MDQTLQDLEKRLAEVCAMLGIATPAGATAGD
jgi:hypothetical protein